MRRRYCCRHAPARIAPRPTRIARPLALAARPASPPSRSRAARSPRSLEPARVTAPAARTTARRSGGRREAAATTDKIAAIRIVRLPIRSRIATRQDKSHATARTAASPCHHAPPAPPSQRLPQMVHPSRGAGSNRDERPGPPGAEGPNSVRTEFIHQALDSRPMHRSDRLTTRDRSSSCRLKSSRSRSAPLARSSRIFGAAAQPAPRGVANTPRAAEPWSLAAEAYNSLALSILGTVQARALPARRAGNSE